MKEPFTLTFSVIPIWRKPQQSQNTESVIRLEYSKYKRPVFDKGYTPNWSEEVFTVYKIQYTNPITYRLKDISGEEISGSFYEQEMQKAVQDVYRIEKVIRRDARKGKALVKWSGYPEKFNSWVDINDLM